MHASQDLRRLLIAIAATLGIAGAALGAAPSNATAARVSGKASAAAAGGDRPPTASLYVTNRDSDNVAAFTIDRTGLPNPGPQPAATGDEPRGIVFTPDGAHAYVVNTAAGTVSAYTVGMDGGLRPLQEVPTEGESAFSIAIAPNGRSLYVSNIDSNTLTAFAIGADGRLTRRGDPFRDTADSPRGLAVSPDSRFLFVGHGFPGESATDVVTTYAIRPGGSLRPIGRPVPGGGAGTGMVVSPGGRYLYVVSTSADAVFGYRIGSAGDLHPLPDSPFPAAAWPEGAAITADGRHLYVASPGPDRANPGHSVSAFTIRPGGALVPVAGSPFTAGDGPVGIAATPDGHRLYVGNFDAGTISAFTIASTGALREVPGSPIPSQGRQPAFQSVAVSPARRGG